MPCFIDTSLTILFAFVLVCFQQGYAPTDTLRTNRLEDHNENQSK